MVTIVFFGTIHMQAKTPVWCVGMPSFAGNTGVSAEPSGTYVELSLLK